MPRKSKRDILIETSLRLFSQYGIHTTGIDRILLEARVAKKTLYNHFRSKDELIIAVLRHHEEHFRSFFVSSVESAGGSPRDRMLAIFGVIEEWFIGKKFYGCFFINAIVEFGGRSNPILNVCRKYKQSLTDYIAGLAKEANANDPDELAERLSLLIEGAIVTVQVSGKMESAVRAQEVAEILIDNECSK